MHQQFDMYIIGPGPRHWVVRGIYFGIDSLKPRVKCHGPGLAKKPIASA